MKFYEIILFLLVINLVTNLVNVLLADEGIMEPYFKEVKGLGEDEIAGAIDDTEASLNEQQNIFQASLNWLSVNFNVKLVINSISIFMKIFINSTVYTKATYSQLLCGWGASCESGSTLNVFINVMWIGTLFVYLFAIIQLLMGRSMREGV